MPLSSLSFNLFRFLLPPTLIALLWLYLYPPLHDCGFPQVVAAQGACLRPGAETPAVRAESAPFRLLVLADPQLEGDTSLPDPNAPSFPSVIHWSEQAREHGLSVALQGLQPTFEAVIKQDLPKILQAYRKRLDLFGNDYYLAHVYRSVKWWSVPTHTVVLGDLLGSQWIDDAEYAERARRFWQRVFRGAGPVSADITGSSGHKELLSETAWRDKIISVVGNHDIGYAGDINRGRIERFEKHFGHVNWEVTFPMTNASDHDNSVFSAGPLPKLRLVILNSMNLDEPTISEDLREETWQFLNTTLSTSSSSSDATVLLTHVPLHKEAGICVDEPLIRLFEPHQGGGIREQNHLRPETSKQILDYLGPNSIILNGHDHEGCDVKHTKVASTAELDHDWQATAIQPSRSTCRLTTDSIHEITVRSMMGSYGGNAGFLSAWYDNQARQWHFEYASCMLGVQHYWWAVHVLVLVELGLLSTSLLSSAQERRTVSKEKTE